MAYTYRLFDSIDDVDLTAWERIRSECDSSIFMDPRFIAVAETSMKPSCQFWYVIVDDASNRPVAAACLFAMTVDLADFADPRLVSIIRRVPKMLSRLAQWKVLICGLPGAPGEKTLALTSTGASPQILSLLDEAVCDLATKTGMNGIVYKEFGADDLKWVNPLLDLGYRRLPAPPMHFFRPLFEDFAHYCAALKAPYRRHIKLSTRKLQNAGVSIAVLTDPAEILRLYTPEVHALYYQVVAKTDMKAEVLPIEFFHQLTLRLKGKVDLVAISRDSKIVAFAWSLHDETSYHLLYGGIDYQFNNELDLYFNLVYATLDRALHERPVKIHVGQTANVFKARLGCYSEPLYVFVKGLGPLMSRVVHYGANFLLAQKPANPPSNVFKETVVESLKDRAKTHCTRASTRCGVQAVDKRPI